MGNQGDVEKSTNPYDPWDWCIYRQALGFAHPPTIGYLTNQLLGILPTNYWVSYQPTYNIPFINFSPPWQPMLLMIQVQVQHSSYQCFPRLATHV